MKIENYSTMYNEHKRLYRLYELCGKHLTEQFDENK